MKVVVASAFLASSKYAHAINTVKMAQGFAKAGHDVILMCRQGSEDKISINQFKNRYNIQEPIRIIFLSRWYGQHWMFALRVLSIVIKIKPDFIYARNYIVPILSALFGIQTVAESHAHPTNRNMYFLQFLRNTKLKNFKVWVTISEYLRQEYVRLGCPKDKIIVLPDAVDLDCFEKKGINSDSPYSLKETNIVYAGHLYDYKGVPTIIQAAKLMPKCKFHLVGGLKQDIDRHKSVIIEEGILNVIFHGFIPHNEVPPYLWNADILLLPPSAKHPSAKWTSPVKLGEYMAAKVPIIASDIPALRDWLLEEEVTFFIPDSPTSLAKTVDMVLASKKGAEQKADKAYQKVQEWSYKSRSEKILEYALNMG